MVKDLDIILSEGESNTIEFKESADKTLVSEVCAFANASGGRVFIGVSDNGTIVGTDTSNAARSRVQDTINQIEPILSVEIEIIDNIIVINVPQGKNKPYSCSKGFYMRFGPNSQKLERNDIIEFFQTEGHIRYDEIVRTDLLLDDNFNDKAYRRYINMAKISEVLDRDSILINLGCAAFVDGKLFYTNAGALFFRDNSLDIIFRHAVVVCVLYKGNDKVHILDAKEFSNGIVENIDDAILFLKKHLKLSYTIKGTQRENVLEIPEAALRETVVNSGCHRNYFEKGARIMIEIFDNRVEITSPGGVAKGVTKENFGTISVTRNPIIASMLHRIRYIEQMGTGINRIKEAVKSVKLSEPKFEMSEFFKVIFERNELQKDGVGDGNKDGIGDGINSTQNKILIEIKKSPKATISELTSIIGISKRNVEKNVQILKEIGEIERIGTNRSGHWNVRECGINDGNKDGIDDGINSTQKKILIEIKKNPKITISELTNVIGVSKRNVEKNVQVLKGNGKIIRFGTNRSGYWSVRE